MYYLLGLDKNLEAIAIVSKNFLKKDIPKASFIDLKEAYFKFTQYIQPNIPMLLSAQEICFVDDSHLSGKLVSIFRDGADGSKGEKISGYDFQQVNDKVILEKKLALVKESLTICQKNNYEYYFLIQLLFSYIFIIQSESVACATIPKAPGLLLLDHKEWSMGDICEMLVHETAHQLVSLDEYRYGHYSDVSELGKPENYAVSAIRRIKRPMNKVIHSLIVAFEILAYRKALAGFSPPIKIHPTTDILVEQILETLNSIKYVNHMKNILAPRANDICYLIENKMNSIL